MKLTSACRAAGLSLALAGTIGTMAMPAYAGDLNNDGADGIRNYGTSTPVPAPIPYQENFKWYVRGDVGAVLKSSGTVINEGLPVSFDAPGSWREQSLLSLGFGQYITPSLRGEITVDIRPDRNLATNATRTPATFSLTGTTTSGGTTTTQANTYGLNSQNEDISYRNYTYLASLFYDFNQRGRFKPYVGAGVGFAYHQIQRNGSEAYNCSSGTTTDVTGGVTTTTNACAAKGGLLTSYTATSNGGAVGYGLAAQLSAGLTVDVSDRVHWDTGYRMLWQSGHVVVSSVEGLNSVGIGDHVDHEIRSGLRWDIW